MDKGDKKNGQTYNAFSCSNTDLISLWHGSYLLSKKKNAIISKT